MKLLIPFLFTIHFLLNKRKYVIKTAMKLFFTNLLKINSVTVTEIKYVFNYCYL